jgi:choline dehydrogenase
VSTPLKTSLPSHADTIVVGAGTGGAAFAATLARNSAEHVLLLEAGPDYGSFESGNWPADMLDALAIPVSHDYQLPHAGASRGQTIDTPRARIVGGCSSHNGCTASVSAAYDYDEWATQGNPGWTAEEVLPLLEWAHQKFRVRRYRDDELTPPQAAFVAAGQALGLPWADDLDAIGAGEGIGPMPVNIIGGVRWNAAFAFLDPVRHLPNLAIAGDAPVSKVLVEDGVATGVEVARDGTSATIISSRVVVAAGAYHSPALLLASGIGPRADLEALGIEVRLDLSGVGRHLLDHACVALDFTGTAELTEQLEAMAWGPDEQSLGRKKSSVCDDGPYDIHVFMVAGANSGHPGLPPVSMYGGAMRARSEGTVTLGPDKDWRRPVIDHAYGTDPEGHDRTVLTEALDLLHRMTEQPVLAEQLGEPVLRDGDPLDAIATYCHPAGTCKMGPATDPSAVVDHRGEVHGIRGLHVADASVMPAITRGNINLPTAMIGSRIAAALAEVSPAAAVGAIAAGASTRVPNTRSGKDGA